MVATSELTSIHAAFLADGADGNHASDIIYDDTNPEQIEALPDTQVHRDVDLELIKADQEGMLIRLEMIIITY